MVDDIFKLNQNVALKQTEVRHKRTEKVPLLIRENELPMCSSKQETKPHYFY